jgi:hypothetical protein
MSESKNMLVAYREEEPPAASAAKADPPPALGSCRPDWTPNIKAASAPSDPVVAAPDSRSTSRLHGTRGGNRDAAERGEG